MIVFLHLEKTAGTTFKFILRNSLGSRHVDTGKIKTPVFTRAHLDFARRVFPGIRAISGHNIVEPTGHFAGGDMFIATILREPVARCLSHYQDNVLRQGENRPFTEWIKDEKHQDLMVRRIAGGPDLAKAMDLLQARYDFLGITENFMDSLRLMGILSPFPLKLAFKRQVIAADNTIRDALRKDKNTLGLAREHNRLDIQLYEFAREKLFLPMIGKHRNALAEIEVPGEIYRTTRTWSYQWSVGYNKFIFRPLVKLGGIR